MQLTTTNPRSMLAAICLGGLMAAGCASMSDTEKRTATGAGIGVAAGAVVGEMATGRPLTGAAVGAAAGAVSGWLYDRHKKNEEAQGE